MNWKIKSRKIHHWAAIIIALPFGMILCTGMLLLLKNEFSWIQPPTTIGVSTTPSISFEQILTAAKKAPDANIHDWKDIDRLDVRPQKGIIKVRSKNLWEIQIDASNGEIKQVMRYNSSLIAKIHNGTWLHPKAKLWLILPCAIILLTMLITGMCLFFISLICRVKRKRSLLATESV